MWSTRQIVFGLAVVIGAQVLWGSRVSGQVVVGVNDLRDLPDHDRNDGLCDCDAVVAGPQCSLRAAVQYANQIGGWVIIQLGGQVYGLDFGGTDDIGIAGDLDVFSGTLSRLEIQGTVGTVIDASALQGLGTPDRIFHITASVNPALEVELHELTISGGAGVLRGAGIRHDAGRLTVADTIISNCHANERGGGVYSSSADALQMIGSDIGNCSAVFDGGGAFLETAAAVTVQINGCRFSSNLCGGKGGGLRTAAGVVAIVSVGSSFSGNDADSGGGVSNRGALTMLDSRVTGNFASNGTGGGLANDIGGSLTLERVEIDGNLAMVGGGLNNSSSASLVDCHIHSNNAGTGGGVYTTAALLRANRCTIASNTALNSLGGGGIRGFGGLDFVNCTISSNTATNGPGGGMSFQAGLFAVELSDCTVAFNGAGGGGGNVFTDNSLGTTTFTLTGSILAHGLPNNFAGLLPLTSAGLNLDDDGSALLAGPGDQANVFPMLAPLQNNGGLTPTHELLPGSPAIDAGSCITVSGGLIIEDQRGMPRISPCDVGSFEQQQLPPPLNDLCVAPIALGPGSFPWSNANAGTDGPSSTCGFAGVPNLDHDVWYEFTAGCDSMVVFNLQGAAFDQLIAVYDLCPQAGGVEIGCGLGSAGQDVSVTAMLVAGQVVKIRLGGLNGQTGSGTIDITQTCMCPADCAQPPDGVVDVNDLLAAINSWGPCAGCVTDFSPPGGDGVVNVNDLLGVINAWGPCP